MADIANVLIGLKTISMSAVREKARALRGERVSRQAVAKKLSKKVDFFRGLSQPEGWLPLGFQAGPARFNSLFGGF